MIRRPPRSTRVRSSAASDVYKRQYLKWISGILLHGDFGRSLWQNTPVAELLGARLPITFQLGFMALIVALCIALPIGIYSAIRQDTAGDYLTRSFSILMLAVPSFWMGTMVMVFPSILSLIHI